jgi:glyoxylase I family protein
VAGGNQVTARFATRSDHAIAGAMNMDDVIAPLIRRRDVLAFAGGTAITAIQASDAAIANAGEQQTTTGLRLMRIDNMDIYTRDLPRMVDFYTRTLGLRFFLPYEPDKGWAAIDFGNLTLYMFEANVGGYAAPRPGDRRVPGIDAFAFEVENIEQAVQALEGKVTWCQPAITVWSHPSGTHYRYRAFYDPDGNKMYVTEPHKVRAAGQGARA